MPKPRRNKALSILEGRLNLARTEVAVAEIKLKNAQYLLEELMLSRDAVARAYERPAKSASAKKREKIEPVVNAREMVEAAADAQVSA